MDVDPFDLISKQAVRSAKKQAEYDNSFIPDKEPVFVNEPQAPVQQPAEPKQPKLSLR